MKRPLSCRRGRREAAANERKPGWEAPIGESHHSVPASQLLGSFPEGRNKAGVGSIHHLADLPTEGMRPGGKRSLGLHWLTEVSFRVTGTLRRKTAVSDVSRPVRLNVTAVRVHLEPKTLMRLPQAD